MRAEDRCIVFDASLTTWSPMTALTEGTVCTFAVVFLRLAGEPNPPCSPASLGNPLADTPIEGVDGGLSILCDLRCLERREIQAKAEEDICDLPESSFVLLSFESELLPTHFAFSAIILEVVECCAFLTFWVEAVFGSGLSPLLHDMTELWEEHIRTDDTIMGMHGSSGVVGFQGL